MFICSHASLHPFFPPSLLFFPPRRLLFLLSLCRTVFILLQPLCFCGAVSLVDTMKTGRKHYLAAHSSHPLRFSLLTYPSFTFALLLSTLNMFFHHVSFRCSSSHFLLRCVLNSPCSAKLSADDWLLLVIRLFTGVFAEFSYLLIFHVVAKANG